MDRNPTATSHGSLKDAGASGACRRGPLLVPAFITPVVIALCGLTALPSGALQPSSPSKPPVGRSLFDRIFPDLPSPFPALVDYLRRETTALTSVLIPFSRSLQRKAGAPDFYRYPRVVLAVGGEWRSGALDVRDKLFIGYNEKSDALEVISYNEDAARFEFQIVHSYSDPNRRKVVYANRATCTACHQNQAPLFSVAPWDETNANVGVAEELKRIHGPRYLGLDTNRALDSAYDFDQSTDRANLASLYQKAWADLCRSNKCRRSAFLAMLKMRLNGAVDIQLGKLEGEMERAWRKAWPQGLNIPSPNISNRNPFDDGFNPMEVEAALEPLNPRQALEIVDYDPAYVANLFGGLALSITKTDAKSVATALQAVGPGMASSRLEEAVKSMPEFTFNPPFRRPQLMKSLFAALGAVYTPLDDSRLPPLAVDESGQVFKNIQGTRHLTTFHRCASCHDNQLGVPPNFMTGTPDQIKTKIHHCAERMFYRLNMWHQSSPSRRISPMPPLLVLEMPEEDWESSAELKAMENYLRIELGGSAKRILDRPFSSLRDCL